MNMLIHFLNLHTIYFYAIVVRNLLILIHQSQWVGSNICGLTTKSGDWSTVSHGGHTLEHDGVAW